MVRTTSLLLDHTRLVLSSGIFDLDGLATGLYLLETFFRLVSTTQLQAFLGAAVGGGPPSTLANRAVASDLMVGDAVC